MRFKTIPILFAALMLAAPIVRPILAHASQTILNVSYDPTREFYEDFDVAFATYWKAKTGQDVTINLSNGGSSKQARAVHKPLARGGCGQAQGPRALQTCDSHVVSRFPRAVADSTSTDLESCSVFLGCSLSLGRLAT